MRTPAEEDSRAKEINAAKSMLHDMYDQQPSSAKEGDVAWQVQQESVFGLVCACMHASLYFVCFEGHSILMASAGTLAFCSRGGEILSRSGQGETGWNTLIYNLLCLPFFFAQHSIPFEGLPAVVKQVVVSPAWRYRAMFMCRIEARGNRFPWDTIES